MTNEQINIAIAEVCGWTEISWEQLTNPREAKDRKHYCKNNTEYLCGWLPDYCNNLNAMRDAWLSLSEEDKFVFDKELQRIILRAKDGQYWLTNATALQRAEAFLRVFGKWEE